MFVLKIVEDNGIGGIEPLTSRIDVDLVPKASLIDEMSQNGDTCDDSISADD